MYAADLPDGLSISGEIKTGVGIFTQDDGDDDTANTYGQAWNDDAGNKFRARLAIGWKNDRAGAKVRFQYRDNKYGNGTVADSIEKAFGWVNLFNKKFVIWGGHGVDDIYGVGGVVDDDVDSGAGIRLELRLIDGLSIAYGLPLSFDADEYAKSMVNIVRESRFGAKYANDFITVIGSFRLAGFKDNYFRDVNQDGDFDDTYPVTKTGPGTDGIWGTDDDIWAYAPEKGKLPAGSEEDVTLQALYEVNLPKLGPVGLDITGAVHTGDYGYFRIAPKVTFATGKLDAHLQGDLNFDIGEDGLDSSDSGTAAFDDYANFGARENPNEDASIGFRVGAGFQIIDALYAYAQIGSDNIGYLDGNGLFIKPGVTLTLGPNTTFDIFDKINWIGAADQSGVKNQLQIDFAWSF
jgi:hypothetical protein